MVLDVRVRQRSQRPTIDGCVNPRGGPDKGSSLLGRTGICIDVMKRLYLNEVGNAVDNDIMTSQILS